MTVQTHYDRNETLDQCRQGVIDDCHQEGMGSIRRIRTGLRLCRIKAARAYLGWGYASFEQYIDDAKTKKLHNFGLGQAKKYMRLVRLPLPLFADSDIDVARLYKVAVRWDQIVAEASDQAEAEAALRLLIERAKNKQSLDEPGLPEPQGKKDNRDLVRKIVTGLMVAMDLLRIIFGRTAGRQLETDWARYLDKRVRDLVEEYAKWRGLAPAELWADRRQTDRGGAEGGGVE